MIATFAEGLRVVDRVFRGRTITRYPPVFRLQEVRDLERLAIAADRLLHMAEPIPGEKLVDDGVRDGNTRLALDKFLAQHFLPRVTSDQLVDLDERARRFFDLLCRREGTFTWRVPMIGLLPFERRPPPLAPHTPTLEARVDEVARLVVLTEALLREEFTLLRPKKRAIPLKRLVGLCALEISVRSSTPADWVEALRVAPEWESIVRQLQPYIGLLLLLPHSRFLLPMGRFDWSDRLTDHPTPRLQSLWPLDKIFPAGSHALPPWLRQTTLVSLAAGMAELAAALTRCAEPEKVREALDHYTIGEMRVLRRPTPRDWDSTAARETRDLFHQCIALIDARQRWTLVKTERYSEDWTMAAELPTLAEWTRGALSSWLRDQAARGHGQHDAS